jgi:hypothetical protein
MVGGSGGTMTGLRTATLPLGVGMVGGSGGTMTGLRTATLPLAAGMVVFTGGAMNGLASRILVLKTKMKTRTAKRTLRAFEVMVVLLLSVKLCTKRVTQLRWNIYNKSNHFLEFSMLRSFFNADQ